MEIITKQGIFQLEDWGKNCTIWPYAVGCYPIATRNGGNSNWYTLGKPIRIVIEFRFFEDAVACFQALTSGEKKIKDYASNMLNKLPLAWID